MDLKQALNGLAQAEAGVLPVEAMAWLQQHPADAGPALIDVIERAISASKVDKQQENLLFFGIHLLGDLRETRAFEPLCRLLRRPSLTETAVDDTVTETLVNILIRTFDGQSAVLQGVVEDPEAEQFVRAAAFDALKLLVALDRLPEADMVAYLRGLPDRLQPREENFIWAAWAMAASDFLLEDLRRSVRKVVDRGFIETFDFDLDEFDRSLKNARAEPDLTKRFKDDLERLYEDSVAELSGWYGFSEKFRQSLTEPRRDEDRFARAELLAKMAALGHVPAVSAPRKIGRNEPCPCGSGKKHKKCCLDKEIA